MTDLEKAKNLGIENAEGLSPAQLKKAIAAAEKLQDEKAAGLKLKQGEAAGLGIEFTSEDTIEALTAKIDAFLDKATEIAKSLYDSKIELLCTFLGIEDFYGLSEDELVELLQEKAAAQIETESEDVVVEEGLFTGSFKGSDGREYVFADDAPASFRYAKVLRTQAEWSEDQDALDLMISGKLSYIKLKK